LRKAQSPALVKLAQQSIDRRLTLDASHSMIQGPIKSD
jgi:hypothetical protein